MLLLLRLLRLENHIDICIGMHLWSWAQHELFVVTGTDKPERVHHAFALQKQTKSAATIMI